MIPVIVALPCRRSLLARAMHRPQRSEKRLFYIPAQGEVRSDPSDVVAWARATGQLTS